MTQCGRLCKQWDSSNCQKDKTLLEQLKNIKNIVKIVSNCTCIGLAYDFMLEEHPFSRQMAMRNPWPCKLALIDSGEVPESHNVELDNHLHCNKGRNR